VTSPHACLIFSTTAAAVFFGMLGVTGFGLFLTPVFYVVIMWFKERRTKKNSVPAPPPLTAEPAL
jgi:multidrug efflux pump